MDAWIQALLIIMLPIDLGILVGGLYLIKAYAAEQALVREQLHDEQVNHREELRYKTALAKAGFEPQENSGQDFMGQLLTEGAKLLMERKAAATPGTENDNGTQKTV